jgi:hypothetical protein
MIARRRTPPAIASVLFLWGWLSEMVTIDVLTQGMTSCHVISIPALQQFVVKEVAAKGSPMVALFQIERKC